jgi:16S rRNA G966 N2-methylase RsmD
LNTQSVGGVFDFISVTPPYVKVSYPELMGLLDQSPLIGPETIVIVEYARRVRDPLLPPLDPCLTPSFSIGIYSSSATR